MGNVFPNDNHDHKMPDLDISSVFRIKNLQDACIGNVFFWIHHVQDNVHDLFRGATSTEEK
jgi:hypothetical protein